MKIIALIIAYQLGTCSEVNKRLEFYVPTMKNVDNVIQEVMALIGAILAILTEVFADHTGGMESYQIASIKITASCGSHVSTLYSQECTIPCNGNGHLLWLRKMHDELNNPLRKFLFNVALDHPSVGTRL